MACFDLRHGFRARRVNPSGKRSIVFNVSDGFRDLPVELPCGQCLGCRLERSRQWAIRCVHEAQMHEENAFITLTYDDEHLPPTGSLRMSDFQAFMKKLRKKFEPKEIRFFHCGEYGERVGRPHYHACIFGLDFADKQFWKTVNGEKYYVSKTLEELWGQGHTMIGAVTFESAAYVARYITKKVTGDRAEEHYEYIDEETGECLQRKPEYVTMSRRPGVGKTWYEKYKKDVYPSDLIVMRGKKMRPPKFYDGQYEIECPKTLQKIKVKRKKMGEKFMEDKGWERLKVREEIQRRKMEQLKRKLEEDMSRTSAKQKPIR